MRTCSRRARRGRAVLRSSLLGTDQRPDLPKGGVLVGAAATFKPIATTTAAIAHRLIVRIRIPPRAKTSSRLCGMRDLGPDLCDGDHTMVDLADVLGVDPGDGSNLVVRCCEQRDRITH